MILLLILKAYLISFSFFFIVYTVFAMKERKGFNFDPMDIAEIFIASATFPISYWFIVFGKIRVVVKRGDNHE